VATERFRPYRQIEAKEESALSRTGDLRVYEGPQNTSSASFPARRRKVPPISELAIAADLYCFLIVSEG
jgi:hypothetical protein